MLEPVNIDANRYIPESAMVVVAHPDDAEFMAAGTVAKWTRGGSDGHLRHRHEGRQGERRRQHDARERLT